MFQFFKKMICKHTQHNLDQYQKENIDPAIQSLLYFMYTIKTAVNKQKNISHINLMSMGPCIVIIFQYINPNQMHMSQSLFYLTTALHVSGVTITHLQEHKTTVTTLKSVPTLQRQQQTTVRVRTSFIILQNLLHFPQNIHYSTIVILI